MSTPFYLAVDIRTDTTTAAIADGSSDSHPAAGVPLDDVFTMPTAILVGAEELLFGQEALDAADAEDERLILDFVPAVGDARAVFAADGEEFAPVDLYAWTVDNVIDRMSEIRGAAPAGVWVVVPATWDDDRITAIADALDRDGRTDVDFLTVPEALASRYAQIDPSDSDLTLVVCDVDDRALQAAIMLTFPDGESQQIGAPVFAAVSDSEEESDEVDERAIDAIVLALSDAGVDIDTLDAVVLSGVSADLDYFRALLVERFGEPIDTDPEPAWATVTGAALALAIEAAELGTAAPTAVLVPSAAATAEAAAIGATHPITSPVRTRSHWYRRPVGAIGLGVGGVLLAGALTVGSAYAIGGIGSSAQEKRTLPEVAVVQASDDPADVAVPAAKPTTPAPAPAPAVPPAAEETDDSTPPVTTPRVPSTTTPRTPATPSTPVTNPEPAPAPAQPAPPVVTPEPTPDPVPTTTPEPTPEPTEEPTPEPTEEPTPDPTPSETSSPTPPAEDAGSDTP